MPKLGSYRLFQAVTIYYRLPIVCPYSGPALWASRRSVFSGLSFNMLPYLENT